MPAAAEVLDDATLVARARTDQRHFEDIYRRYYTGVGTFLLRMLVRPDKIDDLAQTVFIKAMNKLNDLEIPGALRSWLFGIAANVARDEFRRDRTKSKLTFSECASLVCQYMESKQQPPLSAADSTVALRRFEALNPDQREVFILNAVYGYSLSEIAMSLGLPINTVKSRLQRAHMCLSTHSAIGEVV